MSAKKFNPNSIRLCRRCKVFTKYNYDAGLGHSGCMKCGQHSGFTSQALLRILEERGYDINKAIQEDER